MKRIAQKDESATAMSPRMWFVKERGAEQVARRYEIWALLGWYHHHHVAPYLTVRGALMRLWWRITGQKLRLLSPWEALDERMKEIKAERQLRHELADEAAPSPLDPTRNAS